MVFNVVFICLISYSYFLLASQIFQLLFMIVAIMDESSKLMKCSVATQKKLSKTRAVMYNTILFPSSLVVMTFFWTLWHIDRDLVFPKILDVFFPSWLNHMLHTFIILPIIIELILPKKYNFVKFEKASIILMIIFSGYIILYFSIYFRHGVWLYPVHKMLSWPQRGLFSLFQLFAALAFQKLGIALQNTKKPQFRPKVK